MTTKNQIMEMFNGEEMWTDALDSRFEERVCVLFQDGFLVNEGKKFKPTTQEVKAIYNEWATSGEGFYLMKDAEKEFEART